jgi:adenylate kinase
VSEDADLTAAVRSAWTRVAAVRIWSSLVAEMAPSDCAVSRSAVTLINAVRAPTVSGAAAASVPRSVRSWVWVSAAIPTAVMTGVVHRSSRPPHTVSVRASVAAWCRGEESKVRVLMIAPPGAGKGTQGALIAAHFGIPHVASGDLLRDHVARQSDLGRAVQTYLQRGELVPDRVVLDMVREAFVAAKAAGNGYVLDGVPRNIEQARAVYRIALELDMTADVALHLKADDGELMRRLLARAALEGRPDDTEDVIRARLDVYQQATHPILSWYAERGILVSVDAMRPADAVGREILTALEVLRSLTDRVPEHARRTIDLTGLGDAFGDRASSDPAG